MAYVEHLLILIGIYAILSMSLNLVVGFVGLLNLGHAAFFGIGAYTSALLVFSGVPFWIAIVAAGLLAGLGGLLIGIPTLRLRGDYLAIATLGFGEIVKALMKNWNSLTRGPLGLPGIPKPSLFGFVFSTNTLYLILVVIFVIITIMVMSRITNSPFGRVLRSIREDELASSALGKNVVKYKLQAITISAFFAGIAGSLYAHYFMFIDPTPFSLYQMVLILVMVVLGGLGSISGSVLGAVVLVLIPEPLRFLGLPTNIAGAIRQLVYALILLVLMLYKPKGLMKEKSMRYKDVTS